MSGSLDSGRTYGSNMDFADFVAEAVFSIPRNSPAWIVGLRLRGDFMEETHVVAIGPGSWAHVLGALEGVTGDPLAQRSFSSYIRTGQDEENHVRVVALGDRGWLFINGRYEAELDLSELTDSGSVGIFALSDDITEPTRFSDFTVRPLERQYGPLDGSIEHAPHSGFIDTHRTFTWLADGVVEARFFNPYSAEDFSWSSGFLIRQGVSNEFHAVAVRGYGRWFHQLRTDDVESTQELAARFSSHISTSPAGSNHIRIIALGGEGWLFVNGVYMDKLDMVGRTEAGSVSAVGSYFKGDGIAGRSTRFEGLAIWSAGGAP